ncbi:hypothetical protein JQ596_05210 [Bradyrhizobium manausense]|nr:hypothetical protein [Bradyrhizobium manausense]UVO33020.1 hypothetical protein KUF59_00565 [Bradyrhizobium arachidis]
MQKYRTNLGTKLAVIALALTAMCAPVSAETWMNYRIPDTGGSVDIPSSVFTEDGGQMDGGGLRLRRADGQAVLSVQSTPIEPGVSPAAFLASKNPPAGIIYKRVTPRFFVVSSIKRDKIWYNRCNFGGGYAQCVLINYPAAEKRQWDAIVTRISHSLSGG